MSSYTIDPQLFLSKNHASLRQDVVRNKPLEFTADSVSVEISLEDIPVNRRHEARAWFEEQVILHISNHRREVMRKFAQKVHGRIGYGSDLPTLHTAMRNIYQRSRPGQPIPEARQIADSFKWSAVSFRSPDLSHLNTGHQWHSMQRVPGVQVDEHFLTVGMTQHDPLFRLNYTCGPAQSIPTTAGATTVINPKFELTPYFIDIEPFLHF